LKEDTKKFLKELFSGGYRASSIGMALVFSIFIGGFGNVYIMGKKFQDQK